MRVLSLAFQGNVITHEGLVKTECFVVDLHEDVSRAKANEPLEGSHYQDNYSS